MAGGGEVVPVGFGESAGADAFEGDVGFGGEEALAELEVGHFEAEEEDGAALVGGGVAGDVEGEGGFADGGAGAEDDEVAGLEAGELGVEVDEAGGEAGAGVAGAAEVFDVGEAFGEDLVEGADGVGEDVLADGEDACDSAWSTVVGTLSGRE